MIISKLVLNNIGVYAGENELNLETDKSIILVGGLNGRGKTTILEAILFALYGKRVCSFLDYNIKFEDYLRQITNKADGTNCGNILIEFHTSSEDKASKYEVYHEWEIKGNRIVFNTEVKKNEKYDEFLSDNWGMFIEDILPGAIAPFFFFDGEKIAGLAAADSDEQLISSIKSLLGLDVVEQSIEDLNVLLRRKKKDIKDVTYKAELEDADIQLKKKTAAHEELRSRYNKAKSKFKKAEKTLLKVEEKFTLAGGDFKVEKDQLSTKEKLLLERIKENKVKLLEMAAGDLPLVLALSLVESALASVNEETTTKKTKIIIEQLPQMYDVYSSEMGKEFEFDEFYNYIKEHSIDRDFIYNLSDNGHWRLDFLYQGLDMKKNETIKVLEIQQSLKKELEVVQNHLSLSIDEVQVAKIYDELKGASKEKADLEATIKVMEADIEKAEQEIDILNSKRQRVLDNAVSEMERGDQTQRTIEYIIKVRGLLEKYKYEVQKEKIKTLEKTISECIQKITAKEGLISDVVIDPKTLAFTYFNRNGDKVNKSSLSAGEKQLLVIGMLWALGVCSDKELPVVIDTPLARLDSLHRKGLIDNYLPKASNQVIVLSTDQEIAGEDYDRLKPYVGKEYTLVYDDTTMSTTINEGYFGGNR